MRKIINYIKYLRYRRLYLKIMWAAFKSKGDDPEGYATQSIQFIEGHLHKVKNNYLNFGNATGTENSTEVSDE